MENAACSLDYLGPIIDGGCDSVPVHDSVKEEMVVLADEGFAKVDWHPINLRLCQQEQWNEPMLAETVLSRLTLVCHFKSVAPLRWQDFKTRVRFAMALFNLLIRMGLFPDVDGFVSLSMAPFSL